MLTNGEKGLNLAWLILITLPSVGLCYSCVLHSHSVMQTSLGILSAVLIFGALLLFVPRFNTVLPERLMKRSFPFFLVSYLPSAVGNWQLPTTLSTLIWPVILFLFFACSGRLHKWARQDNR